MKTKSHQFWENELIKLVQLYRNSNSKMNSTSSLCEIIVVEFEMIVINTIYINHFLKERVI